MTLHATWLDGGQWPKVKPNPDFPDGKDIDASLGAKKTCQMSLPHPAKRIGYYIITCDVCGLKVALTTAGRPDDPKSVKVACKNRISHDQQTPTT